MPDDRAFLLGEKDLSYGELGLRSRELTVRLFGCGLRAGSRVILSLDHGVHMAVCFLTLLETGLVSIVLEPRAPSRELRNVLDTVAVDGIIADEETVRRWRAENAVPEDCPVLSVADDRGRAWIEGRPGPAAAGADSVTPRESDVALMLPTSGTTGRCKIVELTRRAVFSQVETLRRQLRLSADARVLNVLPTSHIDGLVNGILAAFVSGSAVYNTGGFSPQGIPETLSVVRDRRISHMFLVPTIMALMLKLGVDLKASFDGADFKFFISSGSHLPRSLWEQFESATRRPVVNFYGLTEANNVIFCGPDPATRKLGTLGKPVDCEIRIVDEAGGVVGRGYCGELVLKGDAVMAGYANEPGLTADVLERGWLRTGDLARVDEDGFVEFAGRAKKVIVCGGLNVYPDEVTDALVANPDVHEAVTFGLPHEVWGETVVSCVVAEDGAEVTEQDIVEFARARLSPHKVPERVLLCRDFPKTASGKIDVEAIRAGVLGERSENTAGPTAGDGLEEDVIKTASRLFRTPLSKLDLETSHEQISGWDSLQHLNLVTEMEQRFGIEFGPREIVAMSTLAAVVVLVRNKLPH